MRKEDASQNALSKKQLAIKQPEQTLGGLGEVVFIWRIRRVEQPSVSQVPFKAKLYNTYEIIVCLPSE